MHEFDSPLFKRLAANDTGAAPGHVAGFLVPKDLDRYFPQLTGLISDANPAAYAPITAELFDGDEFLCTVKTNYQYQTWGNTRKFERRITGNLGPIRKIASKNDYIVIERDLIDPEYYRFTLLRKNTDGFKSLKTKTKTKAKKERKWGAVDPANPPIAETDVIALEGEQANRELLPFEKFDITAAVAETRSMKIARSRAFSRRLLPNYDFTCAVCGKSHFLEERVSEAEAAHIVPRGLRGADDTRNGVALCRSHHWAFDRGLFGVQPDRRIFIKSEAAADPQNGHLLPFGGQKIREASDANLQAHPEAFAWHMTNVVQGT